jgi:quercetin dioxygenase-like cupin family protein
MKASPWFGTVVAPHEETCMKITVLTVVLSLWLSGVAAAQVILTDEGEPRLASDSRTLMLKVDPQTVGATQFVVGIETVPPGAPSRIHKHPNQEEILFIHAGTLTVTLGDAPPKEAGAGAVVFIPKDTWIGGANRGSEPATLVFIFPQTGIADLFRRYSPKVGEPTLTPEERVTILRDHAHDIVFKPR